jgi:hypothetical protein
MAEIILELGVVALAQELIQLIQHHNHAQCAG